MYTIMYTRTVIPFSELKAYKKKLSPPLSDDKLKSQLVVYNVMCMYYMLCTMECVMYILHKMNINHLN